MAWADSTLTDDVLTIKAHGATYRMYDCGGKVGAALRQGVPYEDDLLEHIWNRQFEGRALDVGANVGNHTLWLAAVCGLTVDAFEPIKHEDLEANVKLNMALDRRIARYDFALGAAQGKAVHLGAGRLTPESTGNLHVAAIDQLGYTDIAVMKLDVEGWEPDVLIGAHVTIDRCRPVIYTEVHTDAQRRSIGRLLATHGYEQGTVISQPRARMIEWEPPQPR